MDLITEHIYHLMGELSVVSKTPPAVLPADEEQAPHGVPLLRHHAVEPIGLFPQAHFHQSLKLWGPASEQRAVVDEVLACMVLSFFVYLEGSLDKSNAFKISHGVLIRFTLIIVSTWGLQAECTADNIRSVAFKIHSRHV